MFSLKFLSFIILLSFTLCQIPGGWSTESIPSASELAKLYNFALETLSSSNESFKNEEWKVKNLLKYETQVVAGVNYKLVVELINKNNLKSIVYWLIYENLSSELALSKTISILNNSDQFSNLELINLKEFKTKIESFHNYYSYGKIQFNLKKFRWGFQLSKEDGLEIYYLTYDLEGTNNEISLWEHWFQKTQNENLVSDTLLIKKLPVGKYKHNSYQLSNDCENIKSFLICLVKEKCNADEFLKEGNCKNN